MIRQKDLPEKVKQLTKIFTENGVLGFLGLGVAESISTVLSSAVSLSVGVEWLAAWSAQQGIRPELDVPVRILAAAVEWKKKPSIRALLVLQIEERRILEGLLPTSETTGTP